MRFEDYLLSVNSKSYFVNGKEYSYDELRNWYSSVSENEHVNEIKKNYRNWFSQSSEMEVMTSGSTGNPTLIHLPKSKIYQSALSSLNYFNLKKADHVLLALPPDKIGGMMLIIRAIIGELNLNYTKPKLDPFMGYVPKHIKFCSLTPAQLSFIKNSNNSLERLRKIQIILLGGSAIPSNLETFIEREENRYYHSFGMTETISHIAIKILNGPNKSREFEAIPGVTFKKTKVGQLIINAPHILEKELVTNDLVQLIDNQKMIWLGRIDNVINSGGIKIIPEVLEDKLKHLFQDEFYFTSIPDETLGEKLVLVIKGKLIREKKEKYKELISKVLTKHETPKEIYFKSEFVYTENKKLKRLSPNQLLH